MTTFYRRPLPDQCIAFSSKEGKSIFRNALSAGYMEGFFHLIEQFHTQAEPAYCGLGTLSMILNALGMDPNRLWKGPWRWYSEELLDCCVPLETVQKTGISIEEFQCLARCNGTKCQVFRPNSKHNLEHFREMVKITTSSTDQHMVVSYDRSKLKQTGGGHFSPIGGYYPETDQVLILDVARFKYPPHWVPLTILYEAMQTIDPSTNQSRGYLILSKHSKVYHMSIFCRLNFVQNTWSDFVTDYTKKSKQIMQVEQYVDPQNMKQEFVNKFVQVMENGIVHIIRPYDVRFKEEQENNMDGKLREEHIGIMKKLFEEIQNTELYDLIVTSRKQLQLHEEDINAQNMLLTILFLSSVPNMERESCCQSGTCAIETGLTSVLSQLVSPVTTQRESYPTLTSEVEMIQEQIKAIDHTTITCCACNKK